MYYNSYNHSDLFLIAKVTSDIQVILIYQI